MPPKAVYTFTLKGIDVHAILLKNNYIKERPPQHVIEDAVIAGEDNEDDKCITSLADLLQEKSNKYIVIVDPSKNHIKMWINMIDFTKNIFLPISTDKPCWWCRGPFSTAPIGCPIRYYPNTISGYKRERIVRKLNDANLPSNTVDFFETEGIFCSFSCCKAYILNKKCSGRYMESCTLLTLMYYKLYNKTMHIKKAGPIHVIDTWGGHLTLQQYRDSYCQLTYNTTPNIERPLMSNRPYMCPVGTYIEENKIIT